MSEFLRFLSDRQEHPLVGPMIPMGEVKPHHVQTLLDQAINSLGGIASGTEGGDDLDSVHVTLRSGELKLSQM